MANENQDLELDLAEDEGGPKKKKKLIIIGLAAVLLVGAGIAGFLIFSGDSAPAPTGDETSDEPAKPKEPAVYVALPEAVTTSVMGGKKSRTVQIKMSFVVRGDKAKEQVQDHMPQLKNDILMLVSQQNADEIKTPEGRVALQEKTLAQVQTTLTELVGDPVVEKVLFVSFIMQ